jgi:glucan-binding YG repeat protein
LLKTTFWQTPSVVTPFSRFPSRRVPTYANKSKELYFTFSESLFFSVLPNPKTSQSHNTNSKINHYPKFKPLPQNQTTPKPPPKIIHPQPHPNKNHQLPNHKINLPNSKTTSQTNSPITQKTKTSPSPNSQKPQNHQPQKNSKLPNPLIDFFYKKSIPSPPKPQIQKKYLLTFGL